MVPEGAKFIGIREMPIVKDATKTYRLDGAGFIDGKEAMRQAIRLILSIERYEHAIYSPDYGLELDDLYGKDVHYVFPELKERIKEALGQDDRILSVDAFDYKDRGGKLSLRFLVETDEGPIEEALEVQIA